MTDYRVTFTGQCKASLVPHPFAQEAGPGEVLGENLFSMVSTGSERGGYTQQFAPESYPMETGSSSIARVLRVGEGVEGLAPGDLFYHNEHHTRYVRLKAENTILAPKNVAPEKALFGRYAAVSMTSIYRMKAKAVDGVIVTGQGMVGAMCAAVLQVFGFEVYAVDPSAERRAISRAMGIQRVGATLEELAAKPLSCAALMECSGNENALRASLPYLRHGGEIFQVGVPWKKNADWDARDLLYDVFYGFLSLHGGWEWSIPRQSDEFHSHSSYSHIQTAMQLIADGRILIPEEMYELRSPKDCDAVYQEITVPRMRPTSMIFDWRNFEEETL